jgi:hypothetical protein
MILWAGGFDHSFGGYIGAVKLTKSTSASAPAKSTTTTKKATISCVKGKVVKKITGVKPVCPAGYKRK